MCPKITSQTLSYPPASPLPLKQQTTIEPIVLYDFRWFWLWWPSKYIIPFGEHLKQSKPQLTTYPLCHQMRKYNNGKYNGKSQGNKYLKNLCPVTKYKLSMKWSWVHVYNGKSDQSVLPITIATWCLNYHCIQWQLYLNLLSNQMNIN